MVSLWSAALTQICALASAVVSVLLGKRYAQSPQICALVVCLDQQLCCNRCDGFR
jgi:hypothetical protein